jgi:hypothetical protein
VVSKYKQRNLIYLTSSSVCNPNLEREKTIASCPTLGTSNSQPESSQVFVGTKRIFCPNLHKGMDFRIQVANRECVKDGEQNCHWRQDSQFPLISMPNAEYLYICVQILSSLPTFDNDDCGSMKPISSLPGLRASSPCGGCHLEVDADFIKSLIQLLILIRTPIFEWHVVWCGSTIRH